MSVCSILNNLKVLSLAAHIAKRGDGFSGVSKQLSFKFWVYPGFGDDMSAVLRAYLMLIVIDDGI